MTSNRILKTLEGLVRNQAAREAQRKAQENWTEADWLRYAESRKGSAQSADPSAAYVNPWGRTVRDGVAESNKAEEPTDATEGQVRKSRGPFRIQVSEADR